MMTPACPRLLDMINDFVLLRFWARAPRGFKRYRRYIIIIIIIERFHCIHILIDGNFVSSGYLRVNFITAIVGVATLQGFIQDEMVACHDLGKVSFERAAGYFGMSLLECATRSQLIVNIPLLLLAVYSRIKLCRQSLCHGLIARMGPMSVND